MFNRFRLFVLTSFCFNGVFFNPIADIFCHSNNVFNYLSINWAFCINFTILVVTFLLAFSFAALPDAISQLLFLNCISAFIEFKDLQYKIKWIHIRRLCGHVSWTLQARQKSSDFFSKYWRSTHEECAGTAHA